MVFTGECDGLTVDSLSPSLPRSTNSQMLTYFSRLYAHFVVVHLMARATLLQFFIPALPPNGPISVSHSAPQLRLPCDRHPTSQELSERLQDTPLYAGAYCNCELSAPQSPSKTD